MHAPVSPKRPVAIGIYYVILPIWNASIDLSNLTDYIYLSLSLWQTTYDAVYSPTSTKPLWPFSRVSSSLIQVQLLQPKARGDPVQGLSRDVVLSAWVRDTNRNFNQLREAKNWFTNVLWPNSQPHMLDVLKNMFNSQWHIRLNFCECSASIRHGKGNQKGDDSDPCQVPSTWDALQAQWYQWSPIQIPSVLESEAAVVDAGWPEEDPCPGCHLSQFRSTNWAKGSIKEAGSLYYIMI